MKKSKSDTPPQEATTNSPASAPATGTPTRSESRGPVVLLLVAMLVVVAAGLSAGAYLLYPRVEAFRGLPERSAALEHRLEEIANAPDHDVARVESALRELESRVRAIEAKTDSDRSSLQIAVQALSDRLDAQLDRISSEASRAAQETATLRSEVRSGNERLASEAVAGLESLIAQLAERVDRLEAAATLERQASPAGAATLVRLSYAIRESEPFSDALAAYELATGRTLSRQLRSAAIAGAPSRDQLLAEFRAAWRRIETMRDGDAASMAPLDRVKAWAGRLVALRPAGAVAGNDARAVLSRVEAGLVEDDLAGAVAELEALPQPRPEPIEAWLDAARQRLLVEAEYERLLTDLMDDPS